MIVDARKADVAPAASNQPVAARNVAPRHHEGRDVGFTALAPRRDIRLRRQFFEFGLEPRGHGAERPIGADERALPGRVEKVVLAAAAAALARRRADVRADHVLGFEPIERDVDGARRADRAPVRVTISR